MFIRGVASVILTLVSLTLFNLTLMMLLRPPDAFK